MSPSTPEDTPEGGPGIRLRVEGVVQGVGFRWWTKNRAEELDLTGTVRNLSDGSVEITAYGTPDALSTFHRLVREGPASAVVERIHESPAPPTAAPNHGFRIVG